MLFSLFLSTFCIFGGNAGVLGAQMCPGVPFLYPLGKSGRLFVFNAAACLGLAGFRGLWVLLESFCFLRLFFLVFTLFARVPRETVLARRRFFAIFFAIFCCFWWDSALGGQKTPVPR